MQYTRLSRRVRDMAVLLPFAGCHQEWIRQYCSKHAEILISSAFELILTCFLCNIRVKVGCGGLIRSSCRAVWGSQDEHKKAPIASGGGAFLIRCDEKGRRHHFFLLWWRVLASSFLCLCLRIFFFRFLTTLPTASPPIFLCLRSRAEPFCYHCVNLNYVI